MTEKEKSIELYEKFFYTIPSICDEGQLEHQISKQCALIAVDEILKSHYALLTGIKPSTYNYWQKVKEEIEKL